MAAPVVAGAAALLLQARPDLNPDQVKGLLTTITNPTASGAAELDVPARCAPRSAPAPTRALCRIRRSQRSSSRPASTRLAPPGQGELDQASWTKASWTKASWTKASWTGGVAAPWAKATWTCDAC